MAFPKTDAMRWSRVGLLVLVCAAAGYAQRTTQNESAAPVRSARLNLIQGGVTVGDAHGGEGTKAQLNMPLIEGDVIRTSEDGQAEVEFEDGSVVRVTPASSLMLEQLALDGSGRASTRIRLDIGLFYLTLRVSEQGSYFVTAGDEAISPSENAVIRVQNDQPPAEIGVMQGAALVERSQGFSTEVKAGESLRADAESASRYFLTENVPADSWDQWNEEREQAAAQDAAAQTTARDDYAGSQGYGWSDLDRYGSWYDVPGQGQVWQPYGAESSGFDPYGYGSWVSYPGAGYVWASSYAWGWTPYRCGSWSYAGGFGWGWSPGAGCGRVGWGGGYGASFGSRPPGYVPPSRPVRPGVGRTILASRPGRPVVSDPPRSPLRPIVLNGMQVHALKPVGRVQPPLGGSVLGSSLRRDFAVDAGTKRPILGSNARMPVGEPGKVAWHAVDSGPQRPVSGAVVARPQGGFSAGSRPMQSPAVQSVPGGRTAFQPVHVPQAAGQPAPSPVMRPQPGTMARPMPGTTQRAMPAPVQPMQQRMQPNVPQQMPAARPAPMQSAPVMSRPAPMPSQAPRAAPAPSVQAPARSSPK